MKRIILCADDYGQNTTISQAIIALLKKNRLSATSCLTTADDWLSHAKWLQPWEDQIDMGLHFNLTEGKPLSEKMGLDFSSLSDLITKAYLKHLDQSAIETELHAQIDQFIAGRGRLPDFIDGHQHVHQLPVIRDALFVVYEKRLRQSTCYVRCTANPRFFRSFLSSGYIKKILIQLCGAFPFRKELINRHIPHNASFSGIYDFKDAKKYAELFPQFLEEVEDNGIVMCHPGLAGEGGDDPIAHSRPLECHYFQSQAFLEEGIVQNMTLGRFRKNENIAK